MPKACQGTENLNVQVSPDFNNQRVEIRDDAGAITLNLTPSDVIKNTGNRLVCSNCILAENGECAAFAIAVYMLRTRTKVND